MEILVIGKPAVNYYLPLQSFPNDGDIFTIKERTTSIGNVAATAACLLASWNMNVHFAGIVGNDEPAEKIRNTFAEYKINTKFLEIGFTNPTSTNTIILNTKTGVGTKIMCNDPEFLVTRYKYDFVPDYVLMDGTDSAGATALLNNNQTVRTLFYASVANHETLSNAKRCSYVVCTQAYAEGLTKTPLGTNTAGYIDFYQKIVDVCGKANHIIILDNHKILYSVDSKVKMLPEMKIDPIDKTSFDSIFTGTLAFCLANNVGLDDAVKLANTAAAISLNKVGEASAIPSIDDVLDNSGMRNKLGLGSRAGSVKVASGDTPPVAQPDVSGIAPAPEVPQPAAPVDPTVPPINPIAPPGMEAPAPVAPAPVTPEAPAPVAPAPVAPPVMEAPAPVAPAAPAPQPAPAPVETNMFDNPNNV